MRLGWLVISLEYYLSISDKWDVQDVLQLPNHASGIHGFRGEGHVFEEAIDLFSWIALRLPDLFNC